MAQNPLQQYFRQPKVFIGLPSLGVYNKPGTFDGDVSNMPIFGMTGMDELIMKTPDALLSGDSVVKVIASCCPAIKDPWSLANLDIDTILIGIRVATYGTDMSLTQVCPHCSAENEYSFDLTKLIDHYRNCKFESKVVLPELSITLRPLNYRQATDFSLKNFQIQQRLKQADALEDAVERRNLLTSLFEEVAELQNEIFLAGIESVTAGADVVTERNYIKEWIENCESSVITTVKEHIGKNQEAWSNALHKVVCADCDTEFSINVEFDQASFFARA